MTDDRGRISIDERLPAEYRSARLRILSLVENLTPDDGAHPVPACPAWTVADLLAHMTALAAGFGTGQVPTEDRQAWFDALVSERRGRVLADVVHEWDRAGPSMELAIADEPQRRWPLAYDVIAHEHDLRGALGRPGERRSDAVWFGLELGLRLTTADLARLDLPAVRVVADGTELVAGDGPVGLTLRASVFEAFRLLGSRRTEREMRAADFTGDLDRFLPGLVHLRLPTAPFGE